MVTGLNHAVIGPDVVGNDLVGWNLGFNRGKSSDRRFVERVFTKHEQQLIQASDCPDFTLWWLWAAKEACYKASVKLEPVVFSPIQFEIGSSQESVRDAAGRDWVLRSKTGADWLHVWVAPSRTILDRVTACVAHVGNEESQGVRALALDLLVAEGWTGCRIEGRPPAVWQNGARIAGDLSLSHDEGYAAVVWFSGR